MRRSPCGFPARQLLCRSLAFRAMGHVRIVAAFETKRTVQYLTRSQSFESIATA